MYIELYSNRYFKFPSLRVGYFLSHTCCDHATGTNLLYTSPGVCRCIFYYTYHRSLRDCCSSGEFPMGPVLRKLSSIAKRVHFVRPSTLDFAHILTPHDHVYAHAHTILRLYSTRRFYSTKLYCSIINFQRVDS